MQSTVPLAMDQPLVMVMICTFVIILMLVNHTANLDPHINSLLVMFLAANKQRTFLLASTIS